MSGRTKAKKEEDEIPDEIEWDKVTDEMRQHWREIQKSKEAEACEQILAFQRGNAIIPLGKCSLAEL